MEVLIEDKALAHVTAARRLLQVKNGTERFVDVPTLSHPLESVLSSSGVQLGVSGVADRIGEKRKER